MSNPYATYDTKRYRDRDLDLVTDFKGVFQPKTSQRISHERALRNTERHVCIRNWPLPIGAFQDHCKKQ